LDRVLGLPAGDRWRLFVAAVGLPVNALAVRLFGLRRWMELLARSARRSGGGLGPEAELRRVLETGRVVGIASRHAPYHGNCLSRSLTLWWLLLRQGIESDLRIGVTLTPGHFEAHAWIEHRSMVINDRPDVGRRYRTFDRPINSAARFV
jgi:hypothetical protein